MPSRVNFTGAHAALYDPSSKAWELWNEGRSLKFVDPVLDDAYSFGKLMRCFLVGLLCVQERTLDRPTMSDVVSMLNNEAIALPAPRKPAFSTTGTGTGDDASYSPIFCKT
ncbi:PREDICTED: putative cysteine-rich receptor-like protein kinase 32 isoform X2 [Nelumbo nucifera]|uniref:Cysteine-rich receptor-like protein kinase 32 isoform X2 n=1 Tax=Nelumbo nucifera TaxID=4432 RepID=A0A1U8QBP2_NELNU|nr:PREDICTED: putative cysteine-rich receptor-like protein kinase 32 isoform X2 [Nelumbo nucifera]